MATNAAVWAVVMAILSINCKSETERVAFKILAVLCLAITLFIVRVVR